MKTRLPLMLLPLVLVAFLAACGGGGSGSVQNDAVAQVGSTPITKANFNSLIAVACARYKTQGQKCPKVGTTTYTQLRDQAVTFLVQQEELQQEAQKLGVNVTQKDVDNQLEQIQKTYYKNSRSKLLAALKKDDITVEQLEQYNLRPNLLSTKLQAKVASNVQVSTAAAQSYYDKNKTSFETSAVRRRARCGTSSSTRRLSPSRSRPS